MHGQENSSYKPTAAIFKMHRFYLTPFSQAPLRYSAFQAVWYFLVSIFVSEDPALPSVCVIYSPSCQQELSEKVKDRLGPLCKQQSLQSSWELRRQRPDTLTLPTVLPFCCLCFPPLFFQLSVEPFKELLNISTAAAFVTCARTKITRTLLTRQCKTYCKHYYQMRTSL